jgi:hypothetical protein
MDPARWSGFSVDKIQTMFSLWRWL